LARNSIWIEGRQSQFVAADLNLHRFESAPENIGNGGHCSAIAREPEPLVVKPVVDLHKIELLWLMLSQQPINERIEYLKQRRIIRLALLNEICY
jgi:hypothetical protein